MWCDRLLGSQPLISANGHNLFAGLGAVWCKARAILTGSFACLPRAADGEIPGNRWDKMAFIIPNRAPAGTVRGDMQNDQQMMT